MPRRFVVFVLLMLAASPAGAEDPASVARGSHDATVSIALPRTAREEAGGWSVEFDAVPLAVEPTAPFLIEVAVRTADGKERPLGIASLAPPLAIGQPSRVMVPLPAPTARANARDGAITLSVGLVPAVPSDALEDTAIRIENARISG